MTLDPLAEFQHTGKYAHNWRKCPACVADLLAGERRRGDAHEQEVIRLEAEVDRVRDLHRPIAVSPSPFCQHDGSPYPCPTIRALGGTDG